MELHRLARLHHLVGPLRFHDSCPRLTDSICSSALVTTVLRLIIPTAVSIAPNPEEPSAPYIVSIVLTVLTGLLQVAAFLLAGTTNRSAPQGKYTVPSTATGSLGAEGNDESAALLTDKGAIKPISDITSCSPISYLTFAWLSPVLAKGAKLESLTQADLPLLGARDRAPNLYDDIRRTEDSKGPKWMNPLLWRVLLVNKRLFAWRELSCPSRPGLR